LIYQNRELISGQILTITSVSASDAGVYTCKASSSVGAVRKTFHVDILCKYKVAFLQCLGHKQSMQFKMENFSVKKRHILTLFTFEQTFVVYLFTFKTCLNVYIKCLN